MESENPKPWKKPSGVHKIKKLQSQKRALQDRLFEYESPTKKSKQSPQRSTKSLGQPQETSRSNDISTCDSTLMDLLGLRPIPGGTPPGVLNFSYLLASPMKTVPVHTSPVKDKPETEPLQHRALTQIAATSDNGLSPLKSFVAEVKADSLSSPSKDSRKTLVPRLIPTSPSFLVKSKSFSGRRPLNDLLPPGNGGPGWHKELCLDWSLKFGINIISPHPYGWSSNSLKTSEESSGVSAFVRCIDIEPPENVHPSCPSTSSSQLDTSLGAQFHQCCLYWQHPSIPGVTLFPRDQSKLIRQQKPNVAKSALRFEKTTVDSMYSEWADATRSAFQLLKARQCPFFFICTNHFTCLFCSAGTQTNDQTQIYITPATRGLREALDAQKINYTLPYAATREDHDTDKTSDGSEAEDDCHEIHQDVIKKSDSKNAKPKNNPKSFNLLVISGSDSIPFFNFFIGAKSLLVANAGPFAGVPPTILSPVAFHGATLKTLQIEQRNVIMDKLTLHCIDMKGPILPHVLHMLTSLLNKTVKSYKIKLKTLEATIPLNLYSNMNQEQGRVKPSAFDLQNLSDCGLNRGILKVFCQCDNCDTILDMLEGKRGMYRWQ